MLRINIDLIFISKLFIHNTVNNIVKIILKIMKARWLER